jgi:hypothetical protein
MPMERPSKSWWWNDIAVRREAVERQREGNVRVIDSAGERRGERSERGSEKKWRMGRRRKRLGTQSGGWWRTKNPGNEQGNGYLAREANVKVYKQRVRISTSTVEENLKTQTGFISSIERKRKAKKRTELEPEASRDEIRKKKRDGQERRALTSPFPISYASTSPAIIKLLDLRFCWSPVININVRATDIRFSSL